MLTATSFPGAYKLAKCAWNGYDGDSETVNELARHTALKRWIIIFDHHSIVCISVFMFHTA